MKVRELMTAHPSCARPETTVEEIATLMKEENIGCVPVVDEDGQVAGMITDRDIVVRCIAEGKDPAECQADDIISPQSVTIGPDADAREAAQLMADRQIRRLAVVDGGKLVGMLSLGDVAVKQHDDRLSGDVLQEVSEGVKSGSDAGNSSRNRVKTSNPNRGDAGRSSSEESLSEDARPTSRYDSQAISNRSVGEESRRQEKVLPFRENKDNRVRAESMRTREEAEKRATSSAKGTKRAG